MKLFDKRCNSILLEIKMNNRFKDVNLDTKIWAYDPWNYGEFPFQVTIRDLLYGPDWGESQEEEDIDYERGPRLLTVLGISEQEFIDSISRGNVINVTWQDTDKTQMSFGLDKNKVVSGFTGFGPDDV